MHRPAQRPTSTPTCHDQTGEFTGTSTSTSTHQTEEPTIFTTDPQRALSKVRTGRPGHGCTAHFENEIGFFQEFLMKKDFVRAYYLAFD